MDEHTSVLLAPTQVPEMVVQWYQEQACHCKIWSLYSFILLEYMALAYVQYSTKIYN
jgi:hypothetical protein